MRFKKVTAALAATLALATVAHAGTVKVLIDGLNCSLCSEEMRAKLKQTVGATDVEPKLECGFLFFDMPAGGQLSASNLRPLLEANGFTLKGMQASNMTVAEARTDKTLC
jgi:hypothetical protein